MTPTHLHFDEASAIATALAPRLASEDVELRHAHGRVAATALEAPFALPGFVNSAMDGYAIRGVEAWDDRDTSFRIVGQILAGDLPGSALAPGEAVAIMTGAPLPAGTDTVVIREVVRVEDDRLWIPAGIVAGANVRPADDDCAVGAPILSAGEMLTASRLSVLASFGMGHNSPLIRISYIKIGSSWGVPTGQPTCGLACRSWSNSTRPGS